MLLQTAKLLLPWLLHLLPSEVSHAAWLQQLFPLALAAVP
jgi:hypothetical protein